MHDTNISLLSRLTLAVAVNCKVVHSVSLLLTAKVIQAEGKKIYIY